MNDRGGFFLALVLIGAAWGLTFPLSKIAVSGGFQPLGILVWQQVVSIVLTAIVILIRGKSLMLERRHLGLYLGVMLLGTVVPGFFSYTAAAQLPAGVMSLIIALVPLFAMPIALALGFEKPSLTRLLGLVFGALAVMVLVAPQTSLPDPGKAIFVLVAMCSTLAYGGEANFLEWTGRRKKADMPDPFVILFGASAFGLMLTLPLSLGLGHFIDPRAEWGWAGWAIIGISVLSTFAYAGYIWLISHTGPVFSAQVAYLVTTFGLIWSMVLLSESYSGWIWLSLVLILAGLFLVQPKSRDAGP